MIPRIGLGGWLLAAGILLAPSAQAEKPFWSSIAAPSRGKMEVIGGAASGCVAGARALPAQGPGFETIRLSRNRYYGHADTVAFVTALGRRAQAAGLAPFFVGDMAQPRGGPMNFGHASHQNGLDVDIWFNLDPKQPLPPALREDPPLPSMVLADHSAVDPARFGPAQVTLLRLAAGDPKVDRVFVHWTIKRALCDGLAGADNGDRAWLRRIRPWRGHDSHFHVRLRCPAGSPRCAEQAAVPPGDGCDESLDWWFHPLPAVTPAVVAPAPAKRPPVFRAMPAACRAVQMAR